MLLSDILAQPAAVGAMEQALQHDRLAQSYLFVGPSGVGKQATALAVACARNCTVAPGRGCSSCPTCQRILAHNHPDVRVLRPRDEGNRNLQVEFIREELLPFTKFAPFEARTAFVIVVEADICFPQHHAEAANAILKTIEEPRANLVFMLLSDRPSRLLPTIRSRCQQIRFQPLPPEVLTQILSGRDVDSTATTAAIALAGGRADRAIALSEEGKGSAMLAWAQRLDSTIEAGRPGAMLDVAEELAKHEDRSLILDTWALFYRDVAAIGLDSADLLYFVEQREPLAQRSTSLQPERAAQRVARIERVTEELARNGNPEIVLDALLFGMP